MSGQEEEEVGLSGLALVAAVRAVSRGWNC